MNFEKQKPAFSKNAFVAELDGRACPTLKTFYSAIARAMDFPEHFGKNLDGLADCLSDLDWIDAAEVGLVIFHAKSFLAKAAPAKRQEIFDIFQEAMANPIDPEKRLRVVLLE